MIFLPDSFYLREIFVAQRKRFFLLFSFMFCVGCGQSEVSSTFGSNATSSTEALLSISAGVFQDTAVGATHAAVTFTATNSGAATATLSLAPALTTGTRFSITGGTCANGGTIVAGATCTLTVTFTPAGLATYNDTITLTYNNGSVAGQTATRAISGTGVTAASLSIAANTFSNTAFGATHAAVTFTATNSGGAAATLSLAPALTTGTRFTITGGTCVNGGTIAGGATCTVTVTFTPAGVAVYNDTITLTYHNGLAAGQTATRAITGTGVTAATLSIAASTITSTYVGASVGPVTFTVTNTGGVPATLSLAPALTTGTNFAITGGTCTNGASIAAAGTCTVLVTFTPLSNNDSISDTITLTYHNGVLANRTATRLIASSAPPLTVNWNGAFQEVPAGATATTETVTIQNNSAMNATGFTRTLATGSQLTISATTCGVSLAAGASCTVTIRFSVGAPLVIAADLSYTSVYTDTLTVAFTTNGVAQSRDLALSATAAPYFSGLGTAASPYHLKTEAQLRVAYVYGSYFEQDNDIDLQGFTGGGVPDPTKAWINSFTVTSYNGGGHKITNLYADAALGGSGSFVGSLPDGGAISDLTIEEVDLTGSAGNEFGALVSQSMGNCTISDVHVQGVTHRTIRNPGSGGAGQGGLVGLSHSGTLTITNSDVNLDIDANDNLYAGGLVGSFQNELVITGSHSLGTLIGGPKWVGGIVGYADGTLTLGTSYSSLAITDTAGTEYYGGLVGHLEDTASDSTIDQSYFNGSLLLGSGVSYVGGLVGRDDAGRSGTGNFLTISKSYSSATITGGTGVGGIVGVGLGTRITESYSKGSITAAIAGYGAGGFAGTLDLAAQVSNSYNLASVTAADAMAGEVAGFVGNDLDAANTFTYCYSGALSVVDQSANLLDAFTGSSQFKGTYTQNYFRFEGLDVAVQAPGVGIIEKLLDADGLVDNFYVGFTFGADAEWRMPTVNPTWGYLSPVLSWQCGTQGIVCAP